MSITTIFNNGQRELTEKAEELETLSADIVKETVKASQQIVTAVERLELARAGEQQARDNVVWINSEIEEKDNHGYEELKELLTKQQESETDERIFRILAIEEKPRAMVKVEDIASDFQTSIDAYRTALSELRELIERYSSESTENHLNELYEKYEKVIKSQTEQLNKYIGKYSLPVTVN